MLITDDLLTATVHGYSLFYTRLQPLLHTATASIYTRLLTATVPPGDLPRVRPRRERGAVVGGGRRGSDAPRADLDVSHARTLGERDR